MTEVPPRDDPTSIYYDETIEQSSLLERYKEALFAAVLSVWRPWRRRIVNRTRSGLERLAGRGVRATQTKAFQHILDRQADAIDKAFADLQRMLTRELREMAVLEIGFAEQTLEKVLPEVVLGKLEPGAAKRVVSQRPFEGQVLKKHFDRLNRETREALERSVKQGITNGESLTQIVARVRERAGGALQITERNLRSMVHTAVNTASNAARLEVFRANAANIAWVRWVTTLDSSACQACVAFDGRRWRPNDPTIVVPSLHYGCRCDLVPEVAGAPAGERASVSGPVPGDMTYDDWLRLQSVDVQNDVLGKKRAEMWRSGKLRNLDPRLLLNANNRPVTLDVLRKRLERRRRRT